MRGPIYMKKQRVNAHLKRLLGRVMKVGEVIKSETMDLISNGKDVIRLQHPRNGWVRIVKGDDGVWRVTECERPDP